MKKITLLILIGLLTSSLSAQKTYGFLKISGRIVKNHISNVSVYKIDSTTGEWVSDTYQNHKKRYRIKLKPQVKYKLLFTDIDSGIEKELYITTGKDARWIVHLNIDYTDLNELTMYIHQSPNDLCVSLNGITL